jgi:hypothetical protein
MYTTAASKDSFPPELELARRDMAAMIYNVKHNANEELYMIIATR